MPITRPAQPMPSRRRQTGPARRLPPERPHPGTQRSQAKEIRRQALLTAAASLFAVNGFNRVSLEDLGAAAGVSGPAVYRHFPGKQAVLGDLLLTVSRDLWTAASAWWRKPRIRSRHSAGWWRSRWILPWASLT